MQGADANANQLPDLDSLDLAALKALVLAKQSELDSRRTEIENLKLFILKLKRMQFGPRSEKFTRDIAQLELQLEDLEAQLLSRSPHSKPISSNGLHVNPRGVRCPPICHAKPKPSRPNKRPAPIAAAG